MTSVELSHRIAHFYDRSSGLWEEVWGEHMHHGYYGPHGRAQKDHHQAQIDLMDELWAWGGRPAAERVLDAGCGIGGASLHLARKLDAHVTGITLSSVQARRANERAAAAGLSAQTRFEVADALHPPYPPGSFDLVWSLESGEHMPNKRRFMQACAEMSAPHGRLLMIAWCHRRLPPALTGRELTFLHRLYRIYNLPYLISLDSFQFLARQVGFTDIQTADWTDAVSPFWKAVVKSAFSWRSIKGLWQAGRPTIEGAYAMNYMIRGYNSGLIRFGVLQATKR